MVTLDLGPILEEHARHVPYGSTPFLDALPLHDELPNGTIYTPTSVTLNRPAKLRFILDRACAVIDGVKDSQTRFTRAFIDPMGRRRCRQEQREAIMARLSTRRCVPMYRNIAPAVGPYEHIDLSKAYLQIFTRLCWSTEYCRYLYFTPGNGKNYLGDYPFDPFFRVIYSYVVTGSLPTSQALLTYNGSFRTKQWANSRSNPSLVAFVWDVLEAIAWFMVNDFNAVYVRVDGYTVPVAHADRAHRFLDDLELAYKVRHYETHGTWSPIHMDNITMSRREAEWILDRFHWALSQCPDSRFSLVKGTTANAA